MDPSRQRGSLGEHTHAWEEAGLSLSVRFAAPQLVNALRPLTPAPRRRPRCTPGGRDGGCVGEDAAGVGAAGLRLRSARGLASEPVAEALPGLEETKTAGQAGHDAEEAGPGLRVGAVGPGFAMPARKPRSRAGLSRARLTSPSPSRSAGERCAPGPKGRLGSGAV